MGNWKLTRSQEPQALTERVQHQMRHGRPAGLSRRQLIRRSIGAADQPFEDQARSIETRVAGQGRAAASLEAREQGLTTPGWL